MRICSDAFLGSSVSIKPNVRFSDFLAQLVPPSSLYIWSVLTSGGRWEVRFLPKLRWVGQAMCRTPFRGIPRRLNLPAIVWIDIPGGELRDSISVHRFDFTLSSPVRLTGTSWALHIDHCRRSLVSLYMFENDYKVRINSISIRSANNVKSNNQEYKECRKYMANISSLIQFSFIYTGSITAMSLSRQETQSLNLKQGT